MKKAIYLLLFLFLVQFGYFNRDFVEVSILPFTSKYEMPLIVFAFCIFVIAMIISWFIHFFSVRKLKKQLKN